MQTFLRLYDQVDMDLIFLKLRYRDKFPGMVRNCLKAHITGDEYRIEFSGKIQPFAKHPKQPIHVNLNLKPDKDAEILEYLEGIRNFAKSDVIKTIIRSRYIEFPYFLFLPPYITDSNSKDEQSYKRKAPVFIPPKHNIQKVDEVKTCGHTPRASFNETHDQAENQQSKQSPTQKVQDQHISQEDNTVKATIVKQINAPKSKPNTTKQSTTNDVSSETIQSDAFDMFYDMEAKANK